MSAPIIMSYDMMTTSRPARHSSPAEWGRAVTAWRDSSSGRREPAAAAWACSRHWPLPSRRRREVDDAGGAGGRVREQRLRLRRLDAVDFAVEIGLLLLVHAVECRGVAACRAGDLCEGAGVRTIIR